jgi:hypothetical protein
MSSRNSFYLQVTNRFGLVPNFFMSAPNAPEIVEKLWEFAKAAYLDNPMPSLFKERLFVYLSRFCPVRYCIIRHCGFLLGRGHASGDPEAPPQHVSDVLHLLRSPAPWRRDLDSVFASLAAEKKPIRWPEPGSHLEDWVFTAAAVIFVQPSWATRPLTLLREALGGRRFEYFVALLAFIRTAHYWTVTHPGLEIEDDVRDLMTRYPELASLLLKDPDAGRAEGS